MAEITLRIRQITPGFWTDEDLGRLDATQRLCYVGLWCVADDAGWMPWKPREIAYILGFTEKEVRHAVDGLRKLRGKQRIVIGRCRRHAMLPNLIEYQRYAKSTHNVTRHEREHLRECLKQDIPGPGTRPKVEAPPKPHVSPTWNGTERIGTERNVEERGDSRTDEQKERDRRELAERLAARNALPPELQAQYLPGGKPDLKVVGE